MASNSEEIHLEITINGTCCLMKKKLKLVARPTNDLETEECLTPLQRTMGRTALEVARDEGFDDPRIEWFTRYWRNSSGNVR